MNFALNEIYVNISFNAIWTYSDSPIIWSCTQRKRSGCGLKPVFCVFSLGARWSKTTLSIFTSVWLRKGYNEQLQIHWLNLTTPKNNHFFSLGNPPVWITNIFHHIFTTTSHHHLQPSICPPPRAINRTRLTSLLPPSRPPWWRRPNGPSRASCRRSRERRTGKRKTGKKRRGTCVGSAAIATMITNRYEWYPFSIYKMCCRIFFYKTFGLQNDGDQ